MGKKPTRSATPANQSLRIFQSPAESRKFSASASRFLPVESSPGLLLYRAAVDRATGRRKNAVLAAPRTVIPSSASSSSTTRRVAGARRIMQSRLTRPSSSSSSTRNALARSPPSIIRSNRRRRASRGQFCGDGRLELLVPRVAKITPVSPVSPVQITLAR